MSTYPFSTVIGVDKNHLEKMELVLKTWRKHKPSLFKQPMIVFYDRDSVSLSDMVNTSLNSTDFKPKFFGVDVPPPLFVEWPPANATYEHDPSSRFGDSQRYKMLSGFVHVPAQYVQTPYWLKLDVDVVASGMDDWIDPAWFDGPAITAHPWGYTKPAEQMQLLDRWVRHSTHIWPSDVNPEYYPPLDLKPNPGSSMLGHKRIISWCGFFSTKLTQFAARVCRITCGEGKMPVPSQDGVMWYLATRFKWVVRRENMKARGWMHCGSMKSIQEAYDKVMQDV